MSLRLSLESCKPYFCGLFLIGIGLYPHRASCDSLPATPVTETSHNNVAELGTVVQPEQTGKKQKKKKSVSIFYPVRLDQKVIGEVLVVLGADNTVKARPSDLVKAMKPYLSEEVFYGLDADETLKTLSDLNSIPISDFQVTLNNQTQQIDIKISQDVRQVQEVNLSQRDDYYAQEDSRFIKQSNVSGFVNITPNMDVIHEGQGNQTGFRPVSVGLEGAVRLGGEDGVVFKNRGSYAVNPTDEHFTRDSSLLVYDLPQDMMRFSAGDLLPPLDYFQQGQTMGGLSFSKNFSLNPSEVVYPTGRRNLQLDEASEVEVRVNGALYRTLSLDAGQYNLSDFPYSTGNNDVELIVKDRTGRVERIVFNNYQDFNLLKEGFEEYTYNAGFSSEKQQGILEYDTDKPLFTGFHRFGVDNDLTVGGNAQASKQTTTLGTGALWATGIGLVGGNIAVSDSKHWGKGHALSASYRIQSSDKSNMRQEREAFSEYSLQTNFEYYDDAFVGLSDSPSSIRYSLSGAVSTPLSSNASLFVSAQYDDMRQTSSRGVQSLLGETITGTGNYHKVGATLGTSWSISKNLSSLAQVRYNETSNPNTDESSEVAAFLNLIVRLDTPNDFVSTSYNTDTNQIASSYTHSSYNYVDAVSGSVGVSRGLEDGNNAVNGNMNYVGNRFTANVSTNNQIEDLDSSSMNWRSTVRLGTAIAFTEDAVAISRPITDSFAIVETHKTAGDVHTKLNPIKENAVAENDFMGPPVLPELYAYYPNKIRPDVDGLKMGYDIGKGEYDVLPSLHSGYHITLGSDASVTVLGEINQTMMNSLGMTAAKIERVGDADFKPLTTFTNAKGRFAVGGMKEGDYTIRFLTEPVYEGRFTVPANSDALVRVHNISVAQVQ